MVLGQRPEAPVKLLAQAACSVTFFSEASRMVSIRELPEVTGMRSGSRLKPSLSWCGQAYSGAGPDALVGAFLVLDIVDVMGGNGVEPGLRTAH